MLGKMRDAFESRAGRLGARCKGSLLLTVGSMLLLLVGGCEDAMQGDGDSKPRESDGGLDGGGAQNGESGPVALNARWAVMDARSVPASAVPEPTADAAALEVNDVYIIRTEKVDSGNSIETAFASSIASEDSYELVIEFVEEYYAYEVNQVWLELTDNRAIVWGDAITDDCEEFTDYYSQFPLVPPPLLCTPKILNLSREFIGECAHAAGDPPQGAPPWRNQALWSAVGAGTLYLELWEEDLSKCNNDPEYDCIVTNTWQYFEWNFKTSIVTTLDLFNYTCSFGEIPPEPMVMDPPIWASVPLDLEAHCEETDKECGNPQVETVTVSASKPGGGNAVANADLSGSGGIRISECTRKGKKALFPEKNGMACVRSQGCQC